MDWDPRTQSVHPSLIKSRNKLLRSSNSFKEIFPEHSILPPKKRHLPTIKPRKKHAAAAITTTAVTKTKRRTPRVSDCIQKEASRRCESHSLVMRTVRQHYPHSREIYKEKIIIDELYQLPVDVETDKDMEQELKPPGEDHAYPLQPFVPIPTSSQASTPQVQIPRQLQTTPSHLLAQLNACWNNPSTFNRPKYVNATYFSAGLDQNPFNNSPQFPSPYNTLPTPLAKCVPLLVSLHNGTKQPRSYYMTTPASYPMKDSRGAGFNEVIISNESLPPHKGRVTQRDIDQLEADIQRRVIVKVQAYSTMNRIISEAAFWEEANPHLDAGEEIRKLGLECMHQGKLITLGMTHVQILTAVVNSMKQ